LYFTEMALGIPKVRFIFALPHEADLISLVVDDKLYLLNRDFYDRDDRDDANAGIKQWIQVQEKRDLEKEYKKRFQSGSKALYFAQCSDPNETWLPLLEKAFAKAHGDYLAVEGGFVGEAIEDLTGGVTSELHATDILDRDAFWEQELLQVNKQFLFGCGQNRGYGDDRSGIQHRHAYSIMEAKDIDGLRLVKLRNPWGNTEWTGPWSDGSEEWTAEWLQKLGHKFGNDGEFWISFDDLLNAYQHFDRTRLFDQSWKISQQWLSMQVPWDTGYHDTHFSIDMKRPGEVVIVLSQLDDRYYKGLEGQYNFTLQFRVHEQGNADYLVRSTSAYNMRRSTSTEVHLESGVYDIFVKIVATRIPFKMAAEDVVRLAATRGRREKLLAIGLSRDLAYAKAQVKEHDALVKDLEKSQRRLKRKEDAKAAKAAIKGEREKRRAARRKVIAKLEAKRRELYPEDHEEDVQNLQDHHPRGNISNREEVSPAGVSPVNTDAVVAADVPSEGGACEDQTLDGHTEPGPGSSSPDVLVPATINDEADMSIMAEGMEVDHTRDIGAAEVEPSAPADFEEDVESRPVEPLRQQTLPIRPSRPIARFDPPSRRETEYDDNYGPPDGLEPRRWAPPFNGIRPPPPRGGEYPPYRQSTFNTSATPGDDLGSADLSWDSDIDAPTDSDDEQLTQNPFLKQPPPPPGAQPMLEVEEDEYSQDPWNAVCVVGLRVFAKVDNDVVISVVRATGAEQSADKLNARGLDRDHPAADRSFHGFG
jgi:hypothetical protein